MFVMLVVNVSISLVTCLVWEQVLAQLLGMSACTAILLALLRMREQFRSVILEHGIQFVITTGIVLMEMWSVSNLALARPVSVTYAQ